MTIKRLAVSLSLIALAITAASCTSLFGPRKLTAEDIFEKMELTLDPDGKKEDLSSYVKKSTVSNSLLAMKITVITKYKYPDKILIVSEKPGLMKETRGYDGSIGWSDSSLTGKRKIKGKELAAFRFSVDLENPRIKKKDLFSSLELIEPDDDSPYYKIRCIPKKEYQSKPITMYIDKNKFLCRKMIATQYSNGGYTATQSTYLKYKVFNGILYSSKSKTKAMGIEMVTILHSLEDNVEIKDSEFKYR